MCLRVRFAREVPASIGGPFSDEKLDVAVWGYPGISEIKRARIRGYLTPSEVIILETAKWNDGLVLHPDEESLALLLSDEAERVDEILGLEFDEFLATWLRILPGWDESDGYWLDFFLGIVAARAPAQNLPDAVNFVLDEFSFPDDLGYLSHRMDPTAGASMRGLPFADELASYLESRIRHYRSRQTRSETEAS